jgi:hypothetical protein
MQLYMQIVCIFILLHSIYDNSCLCLCLCLSSSLGLSRCGTNTRVFSSPFTRLFLDEQRCTTTHLIWSLVMVSVYRFINSMHWYTLVQTDNRMFIDDWARCEHLRVTHRYIDLVQAYQLCSNRQCHYTFHVPLNIELFSNWLVSFLLVSFYF